MMLKGHILDLMKIKLDSNIKNINKNPNINDILESCVNDIYNYIDYKRKNKIIDAQLKK